MAEEKTEMEEKPEEKDESKKEEKKFNYRLTYDKENQSWTIKKAGASRVIRRTKTKQEALDILKEMEARNEDMKVVVHKKNGKFQKQ